MKAIETDTLSNVLRQIGAAISDDELKVFEPAFAKPLFGNSAKTIVDGPQCSGSEIQTTLDDF